VLQKPVKNILDDFVKTPKLIICHLERREISL